MLPDTPGIHHVTSMVGDPQANVDFYADALGLRLVKRTVNHEDVLRYHFYYGNGHGDLGTVYTCFPYPNEPPGRRGRPQLTATSFAVPRDSLEYWRDRLRERDVAVETRERFDESLLRFEDPSGTRIELVAADSPVDPWTNGPVPAAHAIRGIHGVTALPVDPFLTASVLETLGLENAGQDGDRVRYRAGGTHATAIDVLDANRDADHDAARGADALEATGFGREGTGSIHHVALRVPDEDALFAYHDLFRDRDVSVSRVRDRHYYRSVYVREPGGILIELATEKPGLAVDEPVDALGSSLVLPPWAAEDREMIESQLPAVAFPDQRGERDADDGPHGAGDGPRGADDTGA